MRQSQSPTLAVCDFPFWGPGARCSEHSSQALHSLSQLAAYSYYWERITAVLMIACRVERCDNVHALGSSETSSPFHHILPI